MEARLYGDVSIVQPVGVQPHHGPLRRAAEEVHYATLPHHGDRRLPGCGRGDSFYHDVCAAGIPGEAADGCHSIHSVRLLHDLGCAK
jgi:hypothetical protein